MPRVRCLHDWRIESDWAGDPDVVNGTYSWDMWRCRKCGNEREATREDVADYESYLAEMEAEWSADR